MYVTSITNVTHAKTQAQVHIIYNYRLFPFLNRHQAHIGTHIIALYNVHFGK